MSRTATQHSQRQQLHGGVLALKGDVKVMMTEPGRIKAAARSSRAAISCGRKHVELTSTTSASDHSAWQRH